MTADRVADYRAEIRFVDALQIDTTIASACADHGATRIAVPPALPATWRPIGLELIDDHGLSGRELDALDGAVTGCTLAIAETGTIVLSGGLTEGRRAFTLVPDLHICVVPQTRSSNSSPRRSPHWILAGRSHSSRVHQPHPTSNSAAAKECTARAH